MRRFERLFAWQKCHAVVLAIYRLSDKWPASERYGLTSQLRRAAVSVTSNIAEGSARRGRKDFARFLTIALGSIAECQNLLLLASDLEIGDTSQIDTALDDLGEAWTLTRLLQSSLWRQ